VNVAAGSAPATAEPVLHRGPAHRLVQSVAGLAGTTASTVTGHRLGRALAPRSPAGRVLAHGVDPDDPPWCAPDSVSWQIHSDRCGLIGGVLALWLQALHPLALAGVLDHSDFADDALGRLDRTGLFVATTVFAPGSRAAEACRRLREDIHPHITGTATDGRPYAAGDPHLLDWVHCGFLLGMGRSWLLYGAHPDPSRLDDYVAEQSRVPRELGDPDPPTTWAELLDRAASYRRELVCDERTKWIGRWLKDPPLPRSISVGKPVYRLIHAAALAAAPDWALEIWGERRPGHPRRVAAAALTTYANSLLAVG
jgi:uncharacterized protein (DUF2236 family)